VSSPLSLVRFTPAHAATLRGWYAGGEMLRWLGGCPQLERKAMTHLGFALLDDERMVALAVCEPDEDEPFCTLTYAVAPTLRGRGLGRELLSRLTDHPALAGFERVDAHVEQTNRASTRCFEAAGWRELGTPFEDGELCVYQYHRAHCARARGLSARPRTTSRRRPSNVDATHAHCRTGLSHHSFGWRPATR
jgi:RimJ/RimL family protein N-acetyltransferase